MGERDDIYAGCPHREAIARAANNERRLTRLEADVERNEGEIVQIKLVLARHGLLSGFTGGAGLGTIGLIAYAIGKIAGWW